MAGQEALEYARLFMDGASKIDDRILAITTANYSATGLLLFAHYSKAFPRELTCILSAAVAVICAVVVARYIYYFGINWDGRQAALMAWIDGATSAAEAHKAVMNHSVAKKAFVRVDDFPYRLGAQFWLNLLPMLAGAAPYIAQLVRHWR
jgi:hypothetical protein